MEQCPNKILVNSLIHLRSILIEEETLVLNPKNENKTTFKLLSKTFFLTYVIQIIVEITDVFS